MSLIDKTEFILSIRFITWLINFYSICSSKFCFLMSWS